MHTFETVKDALTQARLRMEKSVEDLRKEVATLRTGRANVSLLDHIRVDYHGTAMPINQLGTLMVPEPTLIAATPLVRPLTATGTELFVVVPSPSWP